MIWLYISIGIAVFFSIRAIFHSLPRKKNFLGSDNPEAYLQPADSLAEAPLKRAVDKPLVSSGQLLGDAGASLDDEESSIEVEGAMNGVGGERSCVSSAVLKSPIVLVRLLESGTGMISAGLQRHGVSFETCSIAELEARHSSCLWILPISVDGSFIGEQLKLWNRGLDSRIREIGPRGIVVLWLVSRRDSPMLAWRQSHDSTAYRNDFWIFTARAWPHILCRNGNDVRNAVQDLRKLFWAMIREAPPSLAHLGDCLRSSTEEIASVAWVPIRQALGIEDAELAWRAAIDRFHETVFGSLVEDM